MNELVKILADKYGIGEDTARSILETVASYAKTRLPASAAGMVDNLLAGDAPDFSGSGMFDLMKGMFGGK